MDSMELYEQWEQRILSRGYAQGARKALASLYRARFGALPPEIATAIDAMHDPETLDRWLLLFALKPADEIVAGTRRSS
jgi:hypothetical protein